MKARQKIIVSILLVIFIIGDVYGILCKTWQAPVSIRVGELTPRSADISLRCTPPVILNEEQTTIAGKLMNASSEAGLSDQTLNLFYRASRDSSWIFISSITTTIDGTFSYLWLNSGSLEAGFYVLNATFSGNDQFDFWTSVTDLEVDAVLREMSSRKSTIVETVREQKASLIGGSVTGDMTGFFNFTNFELISLASGPFSGKGFSKASWEAVLEGSHYDGSWEGTFVSEFGQKRICLKGAMNGDILGTLEGYLFETISESGIYDCYQATWRIVTPTTSAVVNMTGNLIYSPAANYEGCEIYLLQSQTEGRVAGDYNCPVVVVATHLRITRGSTHIGQGFCAMSFVSTFGAGEGWTYEESVSSKIFAMRGLFSDPMYGIVYASSDETEVFGKLFIEIRRVDLGVPPRENLKARIWGPGRASSGQTMTYTIEVRNDGFKSAENMTLVCALPFLTDFILASESGNYDDVIHVVHWDFRTILPKTVKYLCLQLRSFWGLDQGTQLTTSIEIMTEEKANPILQHSSPGLLEWLKRKLQPLWIGCKKTTLKGPGWYALDFAQFTIENPYAIYAIRVNVALRKAEVEESPNLDYWYEVYRLVSVLQGDPHYLQQNGWQTPDGFTLPAGVTFQEAVDALQQHYDYKEINREDKDSLLAISTAHDPNAKFGPEGYVSTSQTLNYTVEYENEGEGTAFGVYFIDTLDQDLDDSTLSIGPVVSTKNGSIIASPGTYNPSIRTITWLVGEVGPGEGGFANFSTKVRNDTSLGTEIINFATVCFPSVPETTRTNGVVSIVAYPHDVATLDVIPSKPFVGEGYRLTVNVNVENHGANAENFNVTVYANVTIVQTETVMLTSGNYTTISLTWNTTGWAKGNYTIWACAEPVPGETNIADNNYTSGQVIVTIPGDIRGDFVVNILDAILLSNAYNSAPGSPNWNPNADINGDYIVNILDAIILSNHYLQHYP